MFLFLAPQPVSKDEYIALKAKREGLAQQIDMLVASLNETNFRFNLLDSIYNPQINLVEVNNKSMGHRYIGRFSIPDITGKPSRLTISIARAEEFESKDDPALKELAKKKALELLKRKFPGLFSDFT